MSLNIEALKLWKEKLVFLRNEFLTRISSDRNGLVSDLYNIREAETYVAQHAGKPKPSQFSLQYIVAMKTDPIALKEALIGERALVFGEIDELETKYAISSDASTKFDLKSAIQFLDAYRSDLELKISQL